MEKKEKVTFIKYLTMSQALYQRLCVLSNPPNTLEVGTIIIIPLTDDEIEA